MLSTRISVAEIRRRAAGVPGGETMIEREGGKWKGKWKGNPFSILHPPPSILHLPLSIWTHGSVDWDQVVQVFPQRCPEPGEGKCADRGISVEAPLSEILGAREVAVRGVWEGTLSGLIGHYPPFEEAWNLIDQLVDKLSRAR